MMNGMRLTYKRVFARNQNFGSSASMQEPLHKQARSLKSFSFLIKYTFLVASMFLRMRDIAL